MNKYLFTTLPSNDLGLLTRSLPIAGELRNRGHQIAFCNPAKAPTKLISEAGFDNLLPSWPLYSLISGNISFESLPRLLRSRHLKRDVDILVSFIRHMSRSSTAEIWNIDHFMYLFGMGNEEFVRVNVEALVELICAYEPLVVLFPYPLISVTNPIFRVWRWQREVICSSTMAGMAHAKPGCTPGHRP